MAATVCPQDLDGTTSLQTPTSLDFKEPVANILGQETVDPVPDNNHSTFDTQSMRSFSSRSSSEEATENAHVDNPEAHPDGLYDPEGYYQNAYKNLDRSGPSRNDDQGELSGLDNTLPPNHNVHRKPAYRGQQPVSHGRKSFDRRSVSFMPQSIGYSPEPQQDLQVRVQGRFVKESGKNYEEDFHTDDLESTEFMPFDYADGQNGTYHGNGYDNIRAHQSGQASMVETSVDYEDDEDQDADGEDDDESMFIPEITTHRPNRVEKPWASHRDAGTRRFARRASPTNSIPDHPAVARRRGSHGKLGFTFSMPNNNLAPSRYSGATMPWGINQQPVMTDQEKVSDASLLKRGITRPPKGEKVCKRSYGANDPENVAIVNLKENTNMTFQEIVDKLNAERVRVGQDPKLTVCGANARYNRTAPIMFAAQGLHFVPLSERKRNNRGHGRRTTKAVWNPEDDEALVETVKYINAEKWRRVADTLNREMRGGRQVYDAESCAKRYAAL